MSDAGLLRAVSETHVRSPRTLILCFDGTNAQYDATNTNVVKFFGLLRKDCTEQQVAYYQAGIGTYFAPGVVSPLFTWLASLMDEAVAWYLDVHVTGGYKFLMDNYHTGDKICLFGFSRGAYTARALAGMLTKVGLLPRDNLEQVDFAYKAYKRTDEEGNQLAAGFKQTFSRDVKVEFVGVWDTVQSTGVFINRALPFADTNTGIRVFRQALSLDEHRARFRPNLYHLTEPGDVVRSKWASTRTVKSALQRLFTKRNTRGEYQAVDSGLLPDDAQNLDEDGTVANRTQTNADPVSEEGCTDVLEVWFSGCHSDIGGGNVRDDVNVSLAQITLHWMVEQVMESKCGILFDNEELARTGFKFPSPSPQPPIAGGQTLPDSVIDDHSANGGAAVIRSPVPHEMPNKAPVSGTYPEHPDAIAPLFDQLAIYKLWWLLEIIPSSNAWQDYNGVWHTQWSINLGRGRIIPFNKPKFHHTVKERMDYEPLKYKPRADWDHDEDYV